MVSGPSGSGKTTLLDLIAGRKTPSYGRQEGDVIVDGVRRLQGTSDDRTSHAGSGNAYVMQVGVGGVYCMAESDLVGSSFEDGREKTPSFIRRCFLFQGLRELSVLV